MAVSESYKECSDIKMKCRESYGLLMERMYKAYKEPSQLDNARGLIERMYHIVDISKSILGQLDMAMVGETPEELTLMARLSAASLSELKKIKQQSWCTGKKSLITWRKCLMPLPERYRCCRKSLPVTEDFLSLLESAAGQNPPVFPCQTEGQ